jgi:phosphoglycerate dehydrogenase-like enzyme
VAISEWVLAVMLAFEKQLPESWIRDPSGFGFSQHPELGMLEGKCLGLVGFGGIGQAVARRALAFDMDVIALRRKPEASPMPEVSIVTELGSVVGAADHLVLAAPATAHTRHLIGRRALGMVRPGVHLVNVARGWLVDSDALLEALNDGRVARASLDVTEPEPLPDDHPLWAHPNVRISPHLSFKRPDLMDRMVGVFIDNLRRYLRGESLQGVVDPVEGY